MTEEFDEVWKRALEGWERGTDGGDPASLAEVPDLARHALSLVVSPTRELVWDVATMLGFAGVRLWEVSQRAEDRALVAEAVDLIVNYREQELGPVLQLPIAQAKPLMDEVPIHPHYHDFLSWLFDHPETAQPGGPAPRKKGLFRR